MLVNETLNKKKITVNPQTFLLTLGNEVCDSQNGESIASKLCAIMGHPTHGSGWFCSIPTYINGDSFFQIPPTTVGGIPEFWDRLE